MWNIVSLWLACAWTSFPPSPGQLKRQVSWHMPELQTPAYAGHGTARISFWPPNTIFRLSWDTEFGDWLGAVSASQKKYDTPMSAIRLYHSAVWNVAEMTLEINLYELIVPFEHCILETEWMENQRNCWRFWNKKCIIWVKELLLLRREISLCGDVLKGQCVMLIKWENFGAFLSWLLKQEIFLTGDVLNKFYCIGESNDSHFTSVHLHSVTLVFYCQPKSTGGIPPTELCWEWLGTIYE
jgi:hypothetical protein